MLFTSIPKYFATLLLQVIFSLYHRFMYFPQIYVIYNIYVILKMLYLPKNVTLVASVNPIDKYVQIVQKSKYTTGTHFQLKTVRSIFVGPSSVRKKKAVYGST